MTLILMGVAYWSSIDFQESASPLMEELSFFHDYTMSLMFLVMNIVTFNMVFVMWFNMTNSWSLAHQKLEVFWTTAPVLILLAIAIPSLQTLYLLDDPFNPAMTVKATGSQWYWTYTYPSIKDLTFDSYMLLSSEFTAQARLLDVDNCLILPANTPIRLITTALDVIHAWTVPSLGLKMDAVPGRMNQLIFLVDRPGVYYGQCSEICGANHSFMPIKIEVIPLSMFISWMKSTFN